jgi:hypothetical protein
MKASLVFVPVLLLLSFVPAYGDNSQAGYFNIRFGYVDLIRNTGDPVFEKWNSSVSYMRWDLRYRLSESFLFEMNAYRTQSFFEYENLSTNNQNIKLNPQSEKYGFRLQYQTLTTKFKIGIGIYGDNLFFDYFSILSEIDNSLTMGYAREKLKIDSIFNLNYDFLSINALSDLDIFLNNIHGRWIFLDSYTLTARYRWIDFASNRADTNIILIDGCISHSDYIISRRFDNDTKVHIGFEHGRFWGGRDFSFFGIKYLKGNSYYYAGVNIDLDFYGLQAEIADLFGFQFGYNLYYIDTKDGVSIRPSEYLGMFIAQGAVNLNIFLHRLKLQYETPSFYNFSLCVGLESLFAFPYIKDSYYKEGYIMDNQIEYGVLKSDIKRVDLYIPYIRIRYDLLNFSLEYRFYQAIPNVVYTTKDPTAPPEPVPDKDILTDNFYGGGYHQICLSIKL